MAGRRAKSRWPARDPYDEELRDAPLHVLLTALSKGSTDVRYLAAMRLYDRAAMQHATLPPLLEAAALGPTNVAIQALEAIGTGWFGEDRKQIVDGLRSLSRGPDPLVRLGAVMAIWRTTGAPQPAVRELRRALRSTDEQVLVFAAADCWMLGREARVLSNALRRLADRSGPDHRARIAAALFCVGAGARVSAGYFRSVLREGTHEQQTTALHWIGSMPPVTRLLARPIADIAEGRTGAPEAVRAAARMVQSLGPVRKPAVRGRVEGR